MLFSLESSESSHSFLHHQLKSNTKVNFLFSFLLIRVLVTDVDHRVAEGPHVVQAAGVQHVRLHLQDPELVRAGVQLLLVFGIIHEMHLKTHYKSIKVTCSSLMMNVRSVVALPSTLR